MFARRPSSAAEIREYLGGGAQAPMRGWELPPVHDAVVRYALKSKAEPTIHIQRGTYIRVFSGTFDEGGDTWAKIVLLNHDTQRLREDLYFAPDPKGDHSIANIAAQGLWHHLQGPNWETSARLQLRLSAQHDAREESLHKAYEELMGVEYIPPVG